jgi:hypothetical protein
MRTQINVNSTENQEIKSGFVNREVYCHVGTMVEDLLKYDMELFEEINWYVDLSEEIEDAQENLKEWEQLLLAEDDPFRTEKDYSKISYIEDKIEEIKTSIEDLEREQEEPREIYEWYAVSSWLGEKLEEKGCVVFQHGLTTIWGRETTGQAILLDSVISEICKDLELLK